MISQVLAVLTVALGVSALATAILIPVLRKLRIVDKPEARSSHNVVAIRGLGGGVLLGVLSGVLASVALSLGEVTLILSVAVGIISIAAVGLVEDVRGLSAPFRAGLQTIIGGVIGGSVVLLAGIPWWWAVVIAVGFAAYVNIANFMDGVDGMSGLHALVFGAVFIVAGSTWGDLSLVAAGAALAGAFLGFLPWNLLRPGTFLGDAGSYLLGGGIALIGITAIASGVPVLAVIAPAVVYVADTGVTLLGRMSQAKPWHRAHRTHTYQRLTDTGMSHFGASLLVAIASLLCAGAGIGGSLLGPKAVPGAVAVMFVVVAIYLALPRILGFRSPPSPAVDPPASFPPVNWDSQSSLRVVVFGASGFVGSHVSERLAADGAIVTRLSAPRFAIDGTPSASDICNNAQDSDRIIASLVASMAGVDVVVNAAGIASPDGSSSSSLTGANALLPTILFEATRRAGVSRFVHISSAAVQGRRHVLDESVSLEPFSGYSRSKALGEQALLDVVKRWPPEVGPELIILRATSVQGLNRPTTRQLRRLAASPFASVASPAERPTVVSSIDGLSEFVSAVSRWRGDVPTVVLQPHEGVTTASVLREAGGQEPRVLPAWLCRTIVGSGYVVAAVFPRIAGIVRRVEVMWFGQLQNAAWAHKNGLEQPDRVSRILSAGRVDP